LILLEDVLRMNVFHYRDFVCLNKVKLFEIVFVDIHNNYVMMLMDLALFESPIEEKFRRIRCNKTFETLKYKKRSVTTFDNDEFFSHTTGGRLIKR
jgi:hypothetical protein